MSTGTRSLHVHFIASGYAADGADAAGETDGATGRAHMEVLYLLPEVCTITITFVELIT